jgi:large subunit ribosomal protein L22
MSNTKYAFQGMKEDMARAMKRDVELSLKVAIEMSAFLKGKTTSEAKTILERVLDMKQAIPYKRFANGVGHRKGAGITVGRFPQKGSAIFIELIKSAEANAQAKGLSTDLKIIHLAPQKSSGAFHSGRQGRRKFKRSHLEIVIQEIEASKDSKKESAPKIAHKKEEQKPAVKEKEHESKKEEKETAVKENHEDNQTETAPKEKKKRAVKKVQEDKQ